MKLKTNAFTSDELTLTVWDLVVLLFKGRLREKYKTVGAFTIRRKGII